MERLEQFNKIMGYDMYARKANVDVTGIDRYKVIEVKDNLNTCYKYLTKKETQKIINYVVDHLKDDKNEDVLKLVIGAIDHELKGNRIRISKKDLSELCNAIVEIVADIIADSIYLSASYMASFNNYFTAEEAKNFLCSIEDGKIVDVEMVQKKENGTPFRVRVRFINGRDDNCVVCSMDIYTENGYEYFSPLIYEKSTGYAYYRHLSSKFFHLDTHVIHFDGTPTSYSRKRFDALYDMYMYGRGASPALCDLRFNDILMCMTAYSKFCKTERKEIKVRSESKVKDKISKEVSDVKGIDKTSFDIYLMDRRTSIEDILTRKVYEKKPWQGGHHASPCEHIRNGYWRRKSKKDDTLIWVDSCTVNPSGKTSKINLDTVVM